MSDAEKIDNDKSNKKRFVDLTTATDEDDSIDERPNKRASNRAAAVPPMTPTMDPFSESSFTQGTCIIYLCCDENTDNFLTGLEKCNDNCNADVHEHCFQKDGTRHISMWQGILDNRQLEYIQEMCKSTNLASKLPITIDFKNGWNSWSAGNYIELSAESTKTLKSLLLLEDMKPPCKKGQISCNHLSLYRKRQNCPPTTNVQFQRVRKALATHKWGSLQGISIRIKVLGGEYDECKVLAETAANAR